MVRTFKHHTDNVITERHLRCNIHTREVADNGKEPHHPVKCCTDDVTTEKCSRQSIWAGKAHRTFSPPPMSYQTILAGQAKAA
jgi:hypothetical protein